jgi:hypothetical protein
MIRQPLSEDQEKAWREYAAKQEREGFPREANIVATIDHLRARLDEAEKVGPSILMSDGSRVTALDAIKSLENDRARFQKDVEKAEAALARLMDRVCEELIANHELFSESDADDLRAAIDTPASNFIVRSFELDRERDRELAKKTIVQTGHAMKADRGAYAEDYGSDLRCLDLWMRDPDFMDGVLAALGMENASEPDTMTAPVTWSPLDEDVAKLRAEEAELLNKAPENKEGVYKFYWDCGRQGSVEGVFVATSAKVELASGNQVYFGEILGKHSEVHGTLDYSDITLISDDPAVVTAVRDNDLASGYNPLFYVRTECPECGNGMSSEDWDAAPCDLVCEKWADYFYHDGERPEGY